MHPYCFALFQRLSLERSGRVDIDGLRELWYRQGDYGSRFEGLSNTFDCNFVNDQLYRCEPGTEYLVADPCHIKGLSALLGSCTTGEQADTISEMDQAQPSTSDPFASLPPELQLMILLQLGRVDVANIRLASRTFKQLPQAYFNHLVRTEMPWVWEIDDIRPGTIDWYKLWCALSAADGGSGLDEKEREWLELSPKYDWDRVMAYLSIPEAARYGLHTLGPEKQRPTYKDIASISEIMEQRRAAGKHLPKPTQIHGLRNRRRIYKDVLQILACISALDVEESG